VKKQFIFVYLTLGIFLSVTSSAQETAQGRYLSFTYENDFFTGTDEYYTQGIRWQYLNPNLNKCFINKILPSLSGPTLNYYGLSFVRDGFTPTSIRHSYIQYGDRPYAGYSLLGFIHICKDDTRKQGLTSELSMGMIGPASGANVSQMTIHRWLHDLQPLGWVNQIQNDFALKYEMTYEKGLINNLHWMDLTGFVNTRVGTLYDDFSLGLLLRLGVINSYFSDIGYGKSSHYDDANYKKHQFYFYIKPKEELVGYNATLQGGMFDRRSDYTIPSGNIQREVYEVYTGFAYNCKSFTVWYSYAVLDKEFTTCTTHFWGSINLGLCF